MNHYPLHLRNFKNRHLLILEILLKFGIINSFQRINKSLTYITFWLRIYIFVSNFISIVDTPILILTKVKYSLFLYEFIYWTQLKWLSKNNAFD